MDILKRLKKKKEDEDSPFSELVKKRPKKEGPKKDDDIEIKPLHVEHESAQKVAPTEPSPKAEEPSFHATGMRELDFDSMADTEDKKAILKEEYVKRVSDLIRNDKIVEAIALLDELQKKLIGGG